MRMLSPGTAAVALVLAHLVTGSLAAQKSPPPTNVTVTGSGGSTTVSWTPVVGRGVTYRVLRGLDARTPGADLSKPIAAASLVDAKVEAGVTYFYQVIAVYENGSVAAAAPVAFTVQRATGNPGAVSRVAGAAGQPVVGVLPGQPNVAAGRSGPAPTNVAAAATPTTVTLTWPALSGVVSYTVERNVGPAGTWTTLPSVSTAPFVDAALNPDTPMQYRITATYVDGRTGVSAPVSVRTTKPANPANLRASVAPHIITAQITPTFQASSVASGDVTLTWDKVAGASYYEVNGTGFSIAKTTPEPTFAIPLVAAGPAKYQVIAYFMNGVRRFGDEANPARIDVMVGSPPVSGFAGVTYAGNSEAGVDFRWTNSNGATSFKLFRGDAEFSPMAEVTDANWAQNWARDRSASLQRGKTYYYKLLSIFPSAPTAFTAVTRIDIPAAVTLQGLTATPTGGTADAWELGGVRLKWLPVAGASEVTILRGKEQEALQYIGDSFGPTVFPGGTTSYDDPRLLVGSTYRYNVCAKIANGSACALVSVKVTR